VNGQWPV
jgi:hypothetical protein